MTWSPYDVIGWEYADRPIPLPTHVRRGPNPWRNYYRVGNYGISKRAVKAVLGYGASKAYNYLRNRYRGSDRYATARGQMRPIAEPYIQSRGQQQIPFRRTKKRSRSQVPRYTKRSRPNDPADRLPWKMLSERGRKKRLSEFKNYLKKNNTKMPRRYKKRMLRKKRKKRRKRRYRVKRVNPHPLNIYRTMNSGNIDLATNTAQIYTFHVGLEDQLDTFSGNVKMLNYDDVGSAMEVITQDLRSAGLEGGNQIVSYSHTKTIKLRNNSNFDCHIQAFWVKPKIAACDDLPGVMISEGLNEKFGTAYSAAANFTTNVNHYVEDSVIFKKHFKATTKKYYHLRADGELTFKIQSKKAYYDPYDNDNNRTQRILKSSRSLILRIVGGISHDQTNLTEVGTGPCLLDWTCMENAKYKKSISKYKRFYTDGGGTMDTFTNAPVQATEVSVGIEEVN